MREPPFLLHRPWRAPNVHPGLAVPRGLRGLPFASSRGFAEQFVNTSLPQGLSAGTCRGSPQSWGRGQSS